MIYRNTVLIVGAGGSAPYGFPTDSRLRNEILAAVRDEHSDIYQTLITGDHFSPYDLLPFHNRLQRADTETIDKFLKDLSHESHLGKAAIAAVLSQYEDPDTLQLADGDHWYQYLVNSLVTACPFDDFKRNNLSIISYNYDRSLEHYLHTSLVNLYGKVSAEIARILQSIPIVHLHGVLSRLPWQARHNTREYRPESTINEILSSASMIQMVHEAGPCEALEIAGHYIAQAEIIIFIGFGYHQDNLDRLHVCLQTVRPNTDIVGTGYGLTTARCSRILDQWGIRVHENPKCKTRQFLEETEALN